MTEIETAAPAVRSPVRWWHVVVVVVGVAIFAGAVVFMTNATSDQDQAASSRRRAAHALADAKSVTRQTRTQLDDLHTQGANVRQQMETFVASADRMMALSDQEAVESATMQRLGADPAVSPADINASINRLNDLQTQYNSERDVFAKLGFGLFGFGDDQAQTVSVRR